MASFLFPVFDTHGSHFCHHNVYICYKLLKWYGIFGPSCNCNYRPTAAAAAAAAITFYSWHAVRWCPPFSLHLPLFAAAAALTGKTAPSRVVTLSCGRTDGWTDSATRGITICSSHQQDCTRLLLPLTSMSNNSNISISSPAHQRTIPAEMATSTPGSIVRHYIFIRRVHSHAAVVNKS